MYLSHKAVHSEFIPAERHKGRYKDAKFIPPPTMAATGDMARNRPRWVQDQRNSWHGVEYPYHSDLDIAEYYKRYAETLLAVDESAGRVLEALRQRGELDSTLVVYMGDNGFAFGEHGLIDKRTAYEESMRVPMLARCPELFQGGQTIKPVIANIDVAPLFSPWPDYRRRTRIRAATSCRCSRANRFPGVIRSLYEYYWERNFPQTPTMHALRGDRYKYIGYHGIWDLNELYDLQEDPLETNNRINDPKLAGVVKEMNEKLFSILENTDGMSMPLWPIRAQYQDSETQQARRLPTFRQAFTRRSKSGSSNYAAAKAAAGAATAPFWAAVCMMPCQDSSRVKSRRMASAKCASDCSVCPRMILCEIYPYKLAQSSAELSTAFIIETQGQLGNCIESTIHWSNAACDVALGETAPSFTQGLERAPIQHGHEFKRSGGQYAGFEVAVVRIHIVF